MPAKIIGIDHDFNSVAKILNLPAATTSGQPVIYEQLNAAIEGLAPKDNVRVATQSNINLSSPGSSIDGITMATNDRVLVRNQTTQSQNGLYLWNGAAVAMTRSADASTFDELESAVVTVDEGTDAGTTWRQTQVNGTIGTNNVIWTSFGNATPDASETTKGIAELATQAETDTGTDDARIVTPAKLKNSPWAVRSYTTTIGDGSATSFTVTHNLGTRNVVVRVYRNSGNYDEVDVGIEHTTTNSVTVLFSTGNAPASNAYNVIVMKAA